MLQAWDNHGYLVSAGTPGEGLWQDGGERQEGGGLVKGHAYSVIQVVEAKGH